MIEITISREDLVDVAIRVARFGSSDASRPALRHLQVVDVGQGRARWTASDSYRLATVVRGEITGSGPVLIPRDLIQFADQAAHALDLDEIMFRGDADLVTLELPSLHVPRPAYQGDYPDLNALLADLTSGSSSELRTSGPYLTAAIHASTKFADSNPETDWPSPLAVIIDAGEGLLTLRTRSHGAPDALAMVPCQAAHDDHVLVNPSYLLELIDAIGDPELVFHLHGSSPLHAESEDGVSVMLMPVEASRPDLRRKLADALGTDPADLVTDELGDYPIRMSGNSLITCRLVEGHDVFGSAATAQFWGVAAVVATANVDLLRELNELNVGLRFGRILWVDGRVEVRAEELLETLDPDKIWPICEEIDQIVERIGPLILAVHGGEIDSSD